MITTHSGNLVSGCLSAFGFTGVTNQSFCSCITQATAGHAFALCLRFSASLRMSRRNKEHRERVDQEVQFKHLCIETDVALTPGQLVQCCFHTKDVERIALLCDTNRRLLANEVHGGCCLLSSFVKDRSQTRVLSYGSSP